MKAPSVAALTKAFRDLDRKSATLIRRLAEAADDDAALEKIINKECDGTEKYVRSMSSDPYRSQMWRDTVALHAMDEILGSYGVEALDSDSHSFRAPRYEYLNMGYTYATTLIYDREKDKLFIGSWGDIAERLEE